MLAAPAAGSSHRRAPPHRAGTANWDNGSIDGLVSRIAEIAPISFWKRDPDACQGGDRRGRARRHRVTLWSRARGPGVMDSSPQRIGAGHRTPDREQRHLATPPGPLCSRSQPRSPGSPCGGRARAMAGGSSPPTRCAGWTGAPSPCRRYAGPLLDGRGAVLAGTSVKLVGLLLLWTLAVADAPHRSPDGVGQAA